LVVISGIWEELASASDGSHRYRQAKPVPWGQVFVWRVISVCGIWEELASASDGSHRYRQAKPVPWGQVFVWRVISVCGIWEELASASDGSHRYRHKSCSPFRADGIYLVVISGIWEEEFVNRIDLQTPTVPTDT